MWVGARFREDDARGAWFGDLCIVGKREPFFGEYWEELECERDEEEG